jgi:hypothetical protein
MCEVDGYQLVLDPMGEPAEITLSPGAGMRARGALGDLRIGIVDNRMTGMRSLATAIEHALSSDFGVATITHWEVPHSIQPDQEVLADIVQRADVAILGLGNCGACTTWECKLSAELRRCIPTLDVVTVPFEQVALASFRGHGLPDQPLVVLPARVETAGQAEMAPFAVAVARACSDELTTS